MAKQFDFNQIGKKMPYTVPDGFFDDFEKAVTTATETLTKTTRQRRHTPVRILVHALTATAAVVAILAMTHALSPTLTPQPTITLEQAFANLDVSDQEYLLDTYSDVSYISDQL